MSEQRTSKERLALRAARQALEHEPENCWATGPRSGDPIQDLIACPGCSAIKLIDEALSATHEPETAHSCEDCSQLIGERDRCHDYADDLAEAIAQITGAGIGEHSNLNNPWDEALDAAHEFRKRATVPPSAATDSYLILSRKDSNHGYALWWRANSCGYTNDLQHAGRYSEEEALKIVRGSDRGEELWPESLVLSAAKPRHMIDMGDSASAFFEEHRNRQWLGRPTLTKGAAPAFTVQGGEVVEHGEPPEGWCPT